MRPYRVRCGWMHLTANLSRRGGGDQVPQYCQDPSTTDLMSLRGRLSDVVERLAQDKTVQVSLRNLSGLQTAHFTAATRRSRLQPAKGLSVVVKQAMTAHSLYMRWSTVTSTYHAAAYTQSRGLRVHITCGCILNSKTILTDVNRQCAFCAWYFILRKTSACQLLPWGGSPILCVGAWRTAGAHRLSADEYDVHIGPCGWKDFSDVHLPIRSRGLCQWIHSRQCLRTSILVCLQAVQPRECFS